MLTAAAFMTLEERFEALSSVEADLGIKMLEGFTDEDLSHFCSDQKIIIYHHLATSDSKAFSLAKKLLVNTELTSECIYNLIQSRSNYYKTNMMEAIGSANLKRISDNHLGALISGVSDYYKADIVKGFQEADRKIPRSMAIEIYKNVSVYNMSDMIKAGLFANSDLTPDHAEALIRLAKGSGVEVREALQDKYPSLFRVVTEADWS